ncbi:MAG: ABC transporter permease [Candidatus Mesenet longicola]|uniref:ABC transporter permease n=1 Tax=Candidatus Mesenet longicola TaxID=1892558 RepID=A0A8J3HUV8_9RICK|nr:MAG: ABC transporter permease [Candidatus Mesenet longicola]GHM59520.1 MAG: ABC transporter permease [Candidatus Mesenet longicola]
MSLNFELMLAFRYLRQNSKFSIMTLFSIIGITIGVATLITVMSVMNGFKAQLFETILGVNGHIVVYFDKDINSNYNQVVESIKNIDGVSNATATTENQVIIKSKSNISGALVYGIAKEDLIRKNIIADHINRGSIKEFDEGIIIGSRLAENLGINYGDYITLVLSEELTDLLDEMPKMKEYRVVATFYTEMPDYDSMLIYIPLKEAQLFFDYQDSIKSIEIFINDLDKAPQLAKTIEEQTSMQTKDWQSLQSYYFNALKTERSVMFLILALIIVVAAFNIVSSLITLVQDKKSAIAIMRTIGATKGSIMRVFCFCGFIIGFIGTFLGCIIGVVFSLNVERIRIFLEHIANVQFLDPMVYFFSTLPVILLPEDVVKVSLLSLSLSLIATIPSAIKAASTNPAEILRYE